MQPPLAPPDTGTVPEQQFDTVASLIAEQIGVAGPWVRLQELLNIERQPVGTATQVHRGDDPRPWAQESSQAPE